MASWRNPCVLTSVLLPLPGFAQNSSSLFFITPLLSLQQPGSSLRTNTSVAYGGELTLAPNGDFRATVRVAQANAKESFDGIGASQFLDVHFTEYALEAAYRVLSIPPLIDAFVAAGVGVARRRLSHPATGVTGRWTLRTANPRRTPHARPRLIFMSPFAMFEDSISPVWRFTSRPTL